MAKVRDASGRSFGSGLERRRFAELELLERGGEIKDLRCQVNVHMTLARILYIADFSYIDVKTGVLTFEETKGFETDVWRIKRRLWMHYGLGPLHVYKGQGTRIIHYETITPRVTNETPD